MIDYVLDAATGATGGRPVVVVLAGDRGRPDRRRGRAPTSRSRTSHAAPATRLRPPSTSLPDGVEEVLVLSGDVPLVQADLLLTLLELRGLDHAAMALVSVDALDPTGLGRVVRNDGGTVERIVEDKDATDEERADLRDQRRALRDRRRVAAPADRRPPARRRRPASCTSPTSSRFAREDGRIVAALDIDDDGRLTGINDRAQLARAEWDMRVELNDRWMRAGVTMLDPSTVYLDHARRARRGRRPRAQRDPARRDVGRGADPDRDRLADLRLARSARTASSGRASSSARSSRTTSRSGRSATCGRARTSGPASEIGNFAELKNSTPRRARTPAPHQLPRRRRRRRRHQRRRGHDHRQLRRGDRSTGRRSASGVFLGVDTMLVAPVTVGDGSKTGAGRRRHEGRAAGQARGGRAGADPRAARRASTDGATAADGTGRRARQPAPTTGRGRHGDNPLWRSCSWSSSRSSRASSSPPRSRSSRSGAAASSSSSRRAGPGRAACAACSTTRAGSSPCRSSVSPSSASSPRRSRPSASPTASRESLAGGGIGPRDRQLRRPRRRHRDPGPVHDRVRGARPEVARARQQRAVRARAVGPARLPRPAARAARRGPDRRSRAGSRGCSAPRSRPRPRSPPRSCG